ncbi:MAG: Protoheme IX farnesyltransferase [Chlamydiae bacterium]|nr:Protoheme IX farnesyltransferase [Chlamydiota bacterium]
MINYYLLMKPGIILGNLVTFAAGFLLASKGEFRIGLFVATLLGLSCIIASACVFNNYIDRDVDKKMERTKKRALALGTVKKHHAIFFAVLLGIAGNLILFIYSNGLTVAVTSVGFFVYVLLYSFLKYQTTYSTLIGSISGAVPPVVGYCAVSNQLDLAAGILFLMMIFWQMPHFFAIALWHFDDYAKAGIPVLPVSGGTLKTKIHMMLYILGLIPIAALLTVFGYTGYLFLTLTIVVGLAWLYCSIKGFGANCDKLWGRQMFHISLVQINAICLLIPFDLVS